MEPRLLILETSGRVGRVALAEGPLLRRARSLDETRRHARDLAPAVAELLAAEGWGPRDLHAVLVSRGPGSYTGLRVGIMSAKALAYATGRRLIAIDTFAAIALQAPSEADCLHVLADAQQEKVYFQAFTRAASGGEWAADSPLLIRPLSEWLAELPPGLWCTGPGLRAYQDRLPPGVRAVDAGQWDPRPESLLRLGLARYQRGEADDLWSVEPLYGRPSSAEEKWAGKEGEASDKARENPPA